MVRLDLALGSQIATPYSAQPLLLFLPLALPGCPCSVERAGHSSLLWSLNPGGTGSIPASATVKKKICLPAPSSSGLSM